MGKIKLDNGRTIFRDTHLNAVTTDTTLTGIDFSAYRRITWFIKITENTGAVTWTIQGSVDGINWETVESQTLTATNDTFTRFYGYNSYRPFMRVITDTQSNATLTAYTAARD